MIYPVDRSEDFSALTGDSERSVPAQCVEAEEAVLGGILIDPNAMQRVYHTLKPEHFYVAANRLVFMAMRDLFMSMQPTDLMMVTRRLKDENHLHAIGGQMRLAQLFERTVSAVNVDQYAALITEKYLRRELAQVGREIQAMEHSLDALPDLLKKAESITFALSQQSHSRQGFRSLSELADAEQNRIVEVSTEGRAPGFLTGFYDIDEMTGGFQPSDLIIMAGRPSMGKTALATACARAIAKNYKKVSAIFSLEMSAEQLQRRCLSQDAEISSGRLLKAEIHGNEWEPLGHAISGHTLEKVEINDTPNITVPEMLSECRRLQSEKGELGLVVIDYLQLMEGEGENRVQALSKITRALKGLARELNVPVVCLSQLSRDVEKRKDKRPMSSDLRDSGSIEQDADLIMMLYRDEYYDENTVDRGIAEVIITKHRNGPTGTVRLLFEPQFTRFLNLKSFD